MTMRLILHVVACLAFASHASRVQTPSFRQQVKHVAEQTRESDVPDLKTLATLLLKPSSRFAFTGTQPVTASRNAGVEMSTNPHAPKSSVQEDPSKPLTSPAKHTLAFNLPVDSIVSKRNPAPQLRTKRSSTPLMVDDDVSADAFGKAEEELLQNQRRMEELQARFAAQRKQQQRHQQHKQQQPWQQPWQQPGQQPRQQQQRHQQQQQRQQPQWRQQQQQQRQQPQWRQQQQQQLPQWRQQQNQQRRQPQWRQQGQQQEQPRQPAAPSQVSTREQQEGSAGEVRKRPGQSPTVTVDGGDFKTFSYSSSAVERLQVVMSTNGKPLEADIQLSLGPDNTPCKMKVYSEDGGTHPFSGVFSTGNAASSTIEIRNTGPVEYPLAAYIIANHVDEPVADLRETSQILQGGSLETYPFNPYIDSVEIMLNTDGHPLNSKIELLQGPGNSKQVIELYTENGLEQPFFAIIDTSSNQMSNGCVIRVVNNSPTEFPMTASVQAGRGKPGHGLGESGENGGGGSNGGGRWWENVDKRWWQ